MSHAGFERQGRSRWSLCRKLRFTGVNVFGFQHHFWQPAAAFFCHREIRVYTSLLSMLNFLPYASLFKMQSWVASALVRKEAAMTWHGVWSIWWWCCCLLAFYHVLVSTWYIRQDAFHSKLVSLYGNTMSHTGTKAQDLTHILMASHSFLNTPYQTLAIVAISWHCVTPRRSSIRAYSRGPWASSQYQDNLSALRL